jgi:hypothetical protein
MDETPKVFKSLIMLFSDSGMLSLFNQFMKRWKQPIYYNPLFN